jgi:TonB family protein
MLSTLLESRHQRRPAGAAGATSFIAHAVVITLAVIATAQTRTPITRPEVSPPIIFHVAPAPAAPSAPAAPATADPAPSPNPMPAPSLPVPTITPVGIPAPSTGPVGTAVLAYPGSRPGTTVPNGVGTGTPGGGEPFGENLVDRPVRTLPGSARPRYPAALTRDRVEGSVSASFVVDTLGRVEPGSFVVVESSHPLFERAVRDALAGMRFSPAEAAGRRVRQLVEQRFLFTLRR